MSEKRALSVASIERIPATDAGLELGIGVCLAVTVVVSIWVSVVVTCGPGIVVGRSTVTTGGVYVLICVVVTVVVTSWTLIDVTVTVGSAAALLATGVGVVTNGLGAGATLFCAGFVEGVGAVTVA